MRRPRGAASASRIASRRTSTTHPRTKGESHQKNTAPQAFRSYRSVQAIVDRGRTSRRRSWRSYLVAEKYNAVEGVLVPTPAKCHFFLFLPNDWCR